MGVRLAKEKGELRGSLALRLPFFLDLAGASPQTSSSSYSDKGA